MHPSELPMMLGEEGALASFRAVIYATMLLYCVYNTKTFILIPFLIVQCSYPKCRNSKSTTLAASSFQLRSDIAVEIVLDYTSLATGLLLAHFSS